MFQKKTSLNMRFCDSNGAARFPVSPASEQDPCKRDMQRDSAARLSIMKRKVKW